MICGIFSDFIYIYIYSFRLIWANMIGQADDLHCISEIKRRSYSSLQSVGKSLILFKTTSVGLSHAYLGHTGPVV